MKSNSKIVLINRITEMGQQFSDVIILMHEAIAKKIGLTGTDHKYLGILLQHGAMPAGELSRLTGLTTGAVTGLIDRLEKKKLVKRVFDKSDRRKIMIQPIAESIMKLTGPAFANLQEKMNSFLLSFSETELKTIEKYNTSCIEVLKDVTADIHKSEKKKSKK